MRLKALFNRAVLSCSVSPAFFPALFPVLFLIPATNILNYSIKEEINWYGWF